MENLRADFGSFAVLASILIAFLVYRVWQLERMVTQLRRYTTFLDVEHAIPAFRWQVRSKPFETKNYQYHTHQIDMTPATERVLQIRRENEWMDVPVTSE